MVQQTPLRLIERKQEHLRKLDIDLLPRGLRGIYVLYRYRRRTQSYNVVYVGMARAGLRGGIRSRLRSHCKRKSKLWTHCSVYKVWDNIRDDEVIELEGLFRQIYALDQRANKLNKQRSFSKLTQLQSILE